MVKDKDTWQAPVQRHMSPRQLALVTKELGLNKAAAGRFIGVSARTARRMFKGTADIPTAVALLLRLMLKHKEAPLVPAWKREQN
jgi:hypothetical protein